MNKSVALKAFKASIPVLTGYFFLGIGFGILLNASGYGIVWSLAMAVFIYAGSLQYVCIGLLSGGASLITVALTSLMVNARHLFYGISMIDRYRNAGKFKPYLIFGLTDETYSLVVNPPELPEKELNLYFFLVSVFNQCYWVTGCLLGSLIGSLIKFDTTGIDFVLTALFITIVTDQWLKSKNHYSALAGIISSVVCLVIFGAENFLIPSMILITVSLLAGRRFTGDAAKDEEEEAFAEANMKEVTADE